MNRILVSRDGMVVAFLASAAACLVLGQWAIRRFIALRWRQPMRHDDCPPLQPLQRSKQGTPTMGGLLVMGVAAAVASACGGLSRREGWWVLGTLLSAGAVGAMDDLLKLTRPNATGLRCWPKLVATLGIGGVIGWLSVDPQWGYGQAVIPWLGQRIELEWWWIPLAAFVVAGSAHAVNLTDGMDGLAVGCLAVAFGVVGIVSSHQSAQPVLAIWCASLAGSCVGFLWFNSAPASVFLGDVGALGLGAALGMLALCSHAAFGLLMIGGIFVAEALSVMLQVASYRWRRHRMFRVAPLHHHFQLGGVVEPKLVVRFWIVGLMLAALGLTSFE